MTRRWLLVVVLLLAALLAAHGRSLGRALDGTSVYAYPLDTCDAHFASIAAPAARDQPLGEGCDTLYSQRMAWDAWRRAGEAWDVRHDVVSFATVDLWQVAVDARSLNLLDLALFVWPARLTLPPGAALAALHVGLVGLAGVAGVGFAWAIGTSPLAGLAAGVVAGSSGVVVESVLRGQYPQASLPAALALFAGLVRMSRGQRGGTALCVAGAAAAALFYWQNVLVLGAGVALFGLGTRAAGPFAPGTARRLAIAVAITTVVCLPAALPVLATLARGAEEKLAIAPWGTPFPADTRDPRDLVDLIDEVPWFVLLSPRGGWLPVLPLLPAAIYGLRGRAGVGWGLLAVAGLLLTLGPLPVVPAGFGGHVVAGYGALPRVGNPVYDFVYQWVPTASRMRHPMRWATLLAVAMTAVTARGVDGLRARWPDHALLAVATALAWVGFVGPWPLRESPFPGDTIAALAGCTAIVLPAEPPGDRERDDVRRLEGLLWVPRTPSDDHGNGGTGAPSATMAAADVAREAALAAALDGEPADLGGACVLFEPQWVGSDGLAVRQRLLAAFGAPVATLVPTRLFAADGIPRRIEVYRPLP